MEIFSPIVGVNFRPHEAKVAHAALSIGDEVFLEPEPENPYDPMAVKVIASDEHIGYIARTNNYEVSDWLNDDGEVEARVVAFEGNKKIILVTWDAE